MSGFFLVFFLFGIAFAGEKETEEKLQCLETTAADVSGDGKACDLTKLGSAVTDFTKNIQEAMEDGSDEEDVKDLIGDFFKAALDIAGCAYRESTKKCGSMAKDSALLKVFVDKMKSLCSTGGAAEAQAWCLKDLSEEERIETTKGFFCALENPSLGTYTKQCFKALLKDKDLKQAVAAMQNLQKMQCTGTDYQNQCLTSYGAVKDQCGADFAGKYYKLMSKSQCGSEIPPPEKLFFDYDPNAAGNLIPTAVLIGMTVGLFGIFNLTR